MNRFKVGDKIVLVDASNWSTHYKGDTAVIEMVGSTFMKVRFDRTGNCYNTTHISAWKLLEEEKKTMTNKSWDFKINDKLGINFSEVRETLSRKNPIALIDAGVNGCYVVIHDSILVKESCLAVGYKLLHLQTVIKVDDASHFSKWVDKVKRIKDAPWPSSSQKSTVKVSLPKV